IAVREARGICQKQKDPPAWISWIGEIETRLFVGPSASLGKRLEACGLFEKCEIQATDWAVPLLGNDDFGAALQVRVILLIDFFPEDEHDQVRILFDGT